MSSRDDILGVIRRHQPAARPLPDVPLFDANLPPMLDRFKEAVTRMGGKLAELPRGSDVDAFVRDRFPDARIICSATPEARGTRDLATLSAPADLQDVDVGVVRARFGVAETGSVFLSETELQVNAIGYLVQHFVILLDPAVILRICIMRTSSRGSAKRATPC